MTRIFTLSLFLASAFLSFAQLPQVTLVQLAGSYASPVDIKSCGDNRLFIVEQKGIIRILFKDGSKQTTPFLDIDARVNNAQDEQGLLGLAFSPTFKTDGYFYVQYTTGPGVDSIRVSRFSVMPGDSTIADPLSEQVLLSFKDLEWNHNGGNLMFGPDGFLYISEGDGGSANDPNSTHGTGGNGQNTNTLFGKMLRIDVSNTSINYSIPTTNPFVGVANARPEIWAYGLRNPWRCSFDRITGDMWIGDVGQNTYEEIDFQPANDAGGQNYGWRCREGLHPCPTSNTTGCPTTGFVDPIHELDRVGNNVCSITGGYVYRGTQYSKLFGRYLFTDYCAGRIWSIQQLGAGLFDVDTLPVTPLLTFNLTSFGEDNLGELYLAYRGSTSSATGRIYKITETSDCNPAAFITLKDSLEACASVTLTALQGDTLSYQWYNSSGIIGGANTNQYRATQSGWYKVLVSKPLHPGCEAFSDSVYANVLDTTELLSSKFFPLCNNGETVDLNNFVTPAGGVYSGTNVQGGSFNPATANIGSNSILYQLTAANGCASQMVLDLPVNEFTSISKSFPIATYCTTDAPFYIGGNFLPDSGVITGTAVANDTFNPALVVTPADAWVYYSFTNENGCLSTDSFQLSVNICTGLQKKEAEISFSISPNPSSGNFKLDVSASQTSDAALQITDATGKVCFSKKLELHAGKTSVALELPLAKGVYSMQLKSEKFNAVKNLVIE